MDIEPFCFIHEKEGRFRCDQNECNKFLCYDCMNESEQFEDLLPSRICYFCHDCIQDIKHTDNNTSIMQDYTENNATKQTNSNRKECHTYKNISLESKKRRECIYIEDNQDSVVQELFPTLPKPNSLEGTNEREIIEFEELISNLQTQEPYEPKNKTVITEEPIYDDNESHNILNMKDDKVEGTKEVCQFNEAEALAQIKQTLYIPSWYTEVMTSEAPPKNIHNDIMHRNWISTELAQEIRAYYPDEGEYVSNINTGIMKADMEAFKEKCEAMFPVGRIFLSKFQLIQAIDNFLEAWNCKLFTHGSACLCFYSASAIKKKPYISKCDPSKKRVTSTSLKLQYKCPFEIKYSKMKCKKRINYPDSFYKVHITTCNYNHTCELSNSFYKTAKNQSRKKLRLILKG